MPLEPACAWGSTYASLMVAEMILFSQQELTVSVFSEILLK